MFRFNTGIGLIVSVVLCVSVFQPLSRLFPVQKHTNSCKHTIYHTFRLLLFGSRTLNRLIGVHALFCAFTFHCSSFFLLVFVVVVVVVPKKKRLKKLQNNFVWLIFSLLFDSFNLVFYLWCALDLGIF